MTYRIVPRGVAPLSRVAGLFCALALVLGCKGGSGSLTPLPAGGHHVLFVGNSLTDANDLPGTLAALAASAGDTIRSSAVTAGDYALIDHLLAGRVQPVIAQGGWEYVILQQGPSTVPVNRDSLVLWTKMYEPLVRAAGGRIALYMVWPDATRAAFFDDCLHAYQAAAQGVNGVFLPAGQAWRTAWARDSTLQLYGFDGYHPSPLGTYVAALVMFERITGHDARALPAQAIVNGAALAVPAASVRLIQQAAHDASQQYYTP